MKTIYIGATLTASTGVCVSSIEIEVPIIFTIKDVINESKRKVLPHGIELKQAWITQGNKGEATSQKVLLDEHAREFYKTIGIRVVLDCVGPSPLEKEFLLHSGTGDIDLVEKYLKDGGDININDSLFGTALIRASRNGKINIVKLLLDKEADVNTTLVCGHPPLWWACWNGNPEIVKLLLKGGAAINEIGYDRTTPLLTGCDQNNIEVVNILLGHGANIDNIVSIILKASRRGNNEIIKLLLDRGADVNSKTSKGWSALMEAVQSRKINTIKLLINRGADIDTIDSDGNTALGIAMRKDDTKIMDIITGKEIIGWIDHFTQYIKNLL